MDRQPVGRLHGATDERQRLDFHVSGLGTPFSSMPRQQREVFLNQMWEARDGRLRGLEQGAKAATKMLEKIHGDAGTGGASGGAKSPTPDQKAYDDAAAHLKSRGKKDAEIQAIIGVRP